MTELDPKAAVAVIGSGTMGQGIAQVAAQAGHPVFLYDNRPQAAHDAIERIRASLARAADRNRLSAGQARATETRLRVAGSLAALNDCLLVIEAIVERLDAKQALFRELEAIVSPRALLATNTSSIPVTAIGAALAYPQRLAGMHFFNPAPHMQLVEIVAGLETQCDVLNTLAETARAWGKTPVHARSTPGFIVNRVARPYYAEALRLLLEQAGDPATLDHLMRTSGGFRMGPFELMDLIGNDVNYAVTQTVWTAFYQDPRFQPSLIQRELVEAGRLGRKSGVGFHDYRDGAMTPAPILEPKTTLPVDCELYGHSAAVQALRTRLQARNVPCKHAAESPDGRLARCGQAVLYLSDGRTATARAAEQGVPDTVLLDLALDYAQTSCLAITTASQANSAARQQAAGLLHAAGYDVLHLGDAPGMLVLRTVAMLANEAADAVHQGVCNTTDADLAMRLGVNYPLGPLQWADALGVQTIATVLANLQAHYGEDRYRTSPRIRQALLAGQSLSG